MSTAGLLLLASLGAVTISEADRRDATGLRAPAPLLVLEASNGGGEVLIGEAPGSRRRAVAQSDSGQRVEAGAIVGRFVSCSGTVGRVQVSVESRAQSTLSGPTGAFELNNVPPGTFDVTVETRGQRATISGIRVVAGQMTNVGDVNLTDLVADPRHCGACGASCPPGASCVYGVCICPEGFIVCGDTCTNLADLEHCRACQNRCVAWPNMAPQCGAQDCLFLCFDGTADCDGRRITGCETRIDSDVNNCGACGYSCATGQRCVESRCR